MIIRGTAWILKAGRHPLVQPNEEKTNKTKSEQNNTKTDSQWLSAVRMGLYGPVSLTSRSSVGLCL